MDANIITYLTTLKTVTFSINTATRVNKDYNVCIRARRGSQYFEITQRIRVNKCIGAFINNPSPSPIVRDYRETSTISILGRDGLNNLYSNQNVAECYIDQFNFMPQAYCNTWVYGTVPANYYLVDPNGKYRADWDVDLQTYNGEQKYLPLLWADLTVMGGWT